MDSRFEMDQYHVRRKFFKLFGNAMYIYGPHDQLVMYTEQKAFKLKEDIRVYGDEAMSEELLTIQARQILDVSATYDVVDAIDDEKVGALKRRGLKSMARDEWVFLDPHHEPLGILQEDSTALSLLRRFVLSLIPQTYYGSFNGNQVCEFRQRFNPFVYKLDLDFSVDTERRLDRRLGLSAAVLLAAIEGHQS